MAELYTYNATTLAVVRESEFTQIAHLGQVGGGRLAIDDTTGTLVIVGQKDFSHTESACAFPLTFRGFIGPRSYGRNAGMERAPDVGASRGIDVALEDTNAMLNFRGLTGITAKRPSETVNARMAWLLGHAAVSSLFDDNGRVASVTTVMDESDYRQQYPGDVLADMVLAAEGFNYYVADWGSGPELTFRNDNTSTADSSTLRISNVLADRSVVTVHPFKDAVLRRDPSVVKSRIGYNHARGTVTDSRPATATAFNGERYMVVSNSNVKTDSKALDQVAEMLQQLSTEEDSIECTVQLTSAQVNLIRHGMRIEAKFSHLATEGYGSFTWFRILERTVTPLGVDAALYNVRLKLSPQEPGEEPDICADLYDETPSDTYYPLGGNPPGTGSPPNPSDGVIYYWRGGLEVPSVPNPGLQGGWHFSLLGAGGIGTIDYAGDNTSNVLVLMTVGNGEWTIQTEIYDGRTRPIHVAVGPSFETAAFLEATTTGEIIIVTIDDATDGDCVRLVKIYDQPPDPPGLDKWGWSAAEWVAA